MDVRCERCQTEYELEDVSVSEAGSQVQCSTCGHTFVVQRGGGAMSGDLTGDESPSAAEWLLETADGQTHRFRNLTSLQKWIIERKVTRQDKISKTGAAWRRLGEIVELAPFFDVVDEADRAKAAAAHLSGGGLHTEAAVARRTGVRFTAAGLQAQPDGGAAMASPDLLPFEPAFETEGPILHNQGRGWWKVIIGLGVAGGVAYLGITRFLPGRSDIGAATPQAMATGSATPPTSGAPPLTSGAPPPAGGAAPPAVPSAPAAGAAASAGATPPAAGGTAGTTPAAAHAPEPAAVAIAGRPGSDGAAGAPAAAAPARPRPAAARPAAPEEERPDKSYDQLVAEGDRLLENGGTARALKVYERAAQMRPGGAEALSGLAYVSLDRGRTDSAIAYFRRALAAAPYGPAVFGLGEAYRATGDSARALEQYERYLKIAPNGADAPAARRQVKVLAAPTNDSPAAPAPAPPAAAPAAPPPPATPSPPPATPPPPAEPAPAPATP